MNWHQDPEGAWHCPHAIPADLRALIEIALTNKRATIKRYADTGHPQEIRILEQAKGAEEAYHAVLEALQDNCVLLKLDAS